MKVLILGATGSLEVPTRANASAAVLTVRSIAPAPAPAAAGAGQQYTRRARPSVAQRVYRTGFESCGLLRPPFAVRHLCRVALHARGWLGVRMVASSGR